jgi:hypothetical protein
MPVKCTYYAELHSDYEGTEFRPFACDSMAVNFYCAEYGADLMAVVKDWGDGRITVVQEFKN